MSLVAPPPSYHDSVRRSKSMGHHQRRPKQKVFVPDTIDRLDDTAFGGFYHHGGPYDATRPSFNRNRKLSPVAATNEGNKAAWKATPRELQLDALLKGRPLDGVGTVPPGERALNGQLMDYEEGEDLMRQMSPGGGAYKRWPGIVSIVDLFNLCELFQLEACAYSVRYFIVISRADSRSSNTTLMTSRVKACQATSSTTSASEQRLLISADRVHCATARCPTTSTKWSRNRAARTPRWCASEAQAQVLSLETAVPAHDQAAAT